MRHLLVATTVLITALAGASQAEDDVFAFVPPGGRVILGNALAAGLPPAEYEKLITGKKSRAEWNAYLSAAIRTIPAYGALDERARDTLAAYLAANMPLSTYTGKTIGTGGHDLPRDGRDLTLEYCQSCHIITVVVTQARSREAWLGTMNKPSHVEIDTTPGERQALADYLERNGGIPIEQIPEELRAGGATY